MVTMALTRAVSCIVRVQVQTIQLWWLVVWYSSGGGINVCCNFVCMYYSVQHIFRRRATTATRDTDRHDDDGNDTQTDTNTEHRQDKTIIVTRSTCYYYPDLSTYYRILPTTTVHKERVRYTTTLQHHQSSPLNKF